MKYQERLLKIIRYPHISEKSSIQTEKYNTFLFKVASYAKKKDIKDAVSMLFSVKVDSVKTLVVKGKIKRDNKKRNIKRVQNVRVNANQKNSWKKAYVILKKGHQIDFLKNKTKNLKK